MADCVNKKNNLASCNCTYASCSRKGTCCECIAYHRSNQQIPACYFDSKTEAGFDRSIDNFINTYKR